MQYLQFDASCALFASLYIPMRTGCKRIPSASTAIQTDKMSKAKEFGSCPDMYRSLNTAELRKLLQNDDKMEQIIALDEKVMPSFIYLFCLFFYVKSVFCFVFLAHPAFLLQINLVRCLEHICFKAHLLPAWRPIGFPSSS